MPQPLDPNDPLWLAMQLHDQLLKRHTDVKEVVAAFASVAVMGMLNDGMPKAQAQRLLHDTIEVAYNAIQFN